MSAFSKISLGRPTKRYTHNMSFDVNTTFDFGSVQPTLVQYLEGEDSFNLSLRQLMRLAPLPVPSFARVHLQHELRFVPMADICPYYEALVAEQPYYGAGTTALYKPDSVPYTSNRTLVQFLCLHYSDFNVLIKDTSSRQNLYRYASNKIPLGSLDPSDSADLSSLNTLLGDYWQGCYGKIGKLSVDHFEKLRYDSDEVTDGWFDTPRPDPNTKPDKPVTGDTYSTITLDSADYVIPVDDTYIFLFRLNSAGRRLRKIFVGCGFSLSINDTESLSLLPLLAFYKAYFDEYAPQRDITWSSTVAYSLVKYIEDHYYVDFSTFFKDTNDDVFPVFVDFITDLSECWYTQLDDFVSAHRKEPITVNRSFSSPDGNSDLPQVVTNDKSSPGFELPYQNDGTSLNNLTIQMLRLVTRFVNKDSVIGGKLSDWLKVHYGSDVANSLYKQSNRVGSCRLDALVSDVISSSDTASSDGGEVLGSYAGQSKAYSDNDKFSYKAPSFGFFIIMSTVVPETGYFQGNDASLYMIDRDTIPVPDYDALGYEVTPKGMIFDDRGVADKTITGGFGFVPRYSCYKRKRNVVNGDMSRRGSIDSYSPYYLDRIISPKDISSVPMSDGSVQVVIHSADIPAASEAFRYTNKYRWLGNSDRIFYQSGSVYKGVSYDGDELIDDNFIVQMILDFKITNKYKPISQSYDTFDEGSDDGSLDVKMD